MKEDQFAPHWAVGGRYNANFVDEYRPDDGSNAVYGTLGHFPSRKLAKQVADALNEAYARGLQHGRTRS